MASNNSIVPGMFITLLAAGGLYEYMQYSKKHLAAETRGIQLKILNVAVEDSDITMNVKILNPNSEKMEVKSFVGKMYASGKYIGDVDMFGDYIAQGNNQITLPLIVKPKIFPLFEELRKQWIKGRVPVTFAGTINVNDHAMPLKLSY